MVKLWHCIDNKQTLIFWWAIISCQLCTSEIHPLYLTTELAQVVSTVCLAYGWYLLIPSGLIRSIVCQVNRWLFKTPIHHILTLFKMLRHLLCTHRMTTKPLAWPRSPYNSPHLSLSTSWQKLHPPAIRAACSHLPPFAHLELLVTVLEFSHNAPSSLFLSWITDTLNCITITNLWIGLYTRLLFCGPGTELYSPLYSAPHREPDTNRYSANVCWIKKGLNITKKGAKRIWPMPWY